MSVGGRGKGGMSRLADYVGKRDFSRTSEPRPGGARKRRTESHRFVIQKHAARRLHYDLRLELGGVLVSWAVTRGPSLDPADKRLAVRTEDHPLDYIDFEGTIPAGSYGGGSMIVWDRGHWEGLDDPVRGLERGDLKFLLRGERLQGAWALVRMKPKPGEKRENWLLIKKRDDAADPDVDPTALWETSVVSGHTVDGVGSESGRRRRPGAAKAKEKTSKYRSGRAVPRFTPPQLASNSDTPPAGSDWLHEIKFDGYRIQAAISRNGVTLYTRNGHDWSERFSSLLTPLAGLDAKSAVIDGEVVAFDGRGRSDFAGLLEQLKSGRSDGLSYMAFDLLELNGTAWRSRPLLRRKQALRKLLYGKHDLLRYVDHLLGDGPEMLEKACELGLEGIMSKRADKPYLSGRSDLWRKIKCIGRDEFVIGGWRKSDTRHRPFASLLVGSFDGTRLVYRGRVGTGFEASQMAGLSHELKKRRIDTPPFEILPRDASRGAVWARPDLVAEIEYSGWTGSGVLLHARFVGLRSDKKPRQVTTGNQTPLPSVTGVKLTSPEKILFPGDDITKAQLADYYSKLAGQILFHLRDRPVSLLRCPDGRAGDCFFQKHRSAGMDEDLKALPVTGKTGRSKDYIVIENGNGVLAGAQYGVLEFHIWGARKDRIDRPDRLVFDLDPGAEVDFAAVREAAFLLRDLLAAADLGTYALVTGGKGVHVVTRLARRHDWEVVKSFSRDVARALERAEPDRFVATSTIAKRRGRIFIDWMRNQRGATAIAPFSPRARSGAPVAVPVTWEELATLPAANCFDLATVVHRVRRAPDAWAGYFETSHSITKGVRAQVAGF